MASFLQQPSDGTLKAVAEHGSDQCWASLGVADHQSLEALVERGNEPAALFLASHVKQLDAGQLQDALTALGQFAAYHMREFLLYTSDVLTEREFRDALTMLPLDLADDFGTQLTELRARRIALEHVTDPQIQGRRAAAIAVLDDSIAELEGTKAQGPAPKH